MWCINRKTAAVLLLYLLLLSVSFSFPLHVNNKQNRNIKKILFITGIMGNVVFALRINNTGIGLICGNYRLNI